MKVVKRVQAGVGPPSFELQDDSGAEISVVGGFLRHLRARDCSPNTVSAYAYDLLHLWRFFGEREISYEDFTPPVAVCFLEYLRNVASRRQAQRLRPVLMFADGEQPSRRLSPTSVNRILAAVSAFYEYLIVAGRWAQPENPIQKQADPALARVSERHKPFMGDASRQRPVRRSLRVKTEELLPRPMEAEDFRTLLNSFARLRDRAMLLLMYQGGLRPGEVLNVHLEDIKYGRRLLEVRWRTDHPKGVRTKSRVERVVHLYEPEALQALSDYVQWERPREAGTALVFLVGGKGQRRCEALGYHALQKLFARHCAKLGLRDPWTTPHALRHSHATNLWEGGMRELALQKRLGHSSPESTRKYTRVSDRVVIAEYRRAVGLEGDA
jgi:integrase